MSAGTLISLEEYLHTPYSPDWEFRDGALVERNLGDEAHSVLQIALGAYFHRRRKRWNIRAYTELRIKIRDSWYPISDVCVYPLPAPKERFPSQPPLLWIEILSEDDRMREVWEKAAELVKCGVPYVWIIDPITLESDLFTVEGRTAISDKTFRLPNSPIVIPLAEVMEE